MIPYDQRRASRSADLYGKEVGAEARARQEQEARERFVCCGEQRVDGHHEECPNWKPVVHPDQEALL